jgi:hypothetical protein
MLHHRRLEVDGIRCALQFRPGWGMMASAHHWVLEVLNCCETLNKAKGALDDMRTRVPIGTHPGSAWPWELAGTGNAPQSKYRRWAHGTD